MVLSVEGPCSHDSPESMAAFFLAASGSLGDLNSPTRYRTWAKVSGSAEP